MLEEWHACHEEMSDVYDLHIDTDVTVQLSDCRQEDARAVFEVLDHYYRLEDIEPPGPAGSGPATTVWMATFDTSGGQREEPRPPRLTGKVGALLTGGYHAVGEVERVLAGSFDIESLQAVSGDQETEARLLLASR
ncbi:hypothetical protein [Streptomyces sp. NPDC058955]|uniref:hypothetical protein n=1 Tax=unclassified Streptomyces TaxID=2593676 RepID=UPI0036470950